MDSLTQIVLGAAVGEAVAGRRAGNKAILWGAVAGTIPDLDILFNPLLDQVDQLAMHRGLSHSFVFAALGAPVFGWVARRFNRKTSDGATFRDWTLVGFFGFLTHIILDYLTIYGTQLFRPFSDYPAALGTLFIIDPLYTVPLALSVLAAMVFARSDSRRRFVNRAGLALSSLYILFSIVAKFQAVDEFERQLAQQNKTYDRLFVAPMPLNTMLWMVLADDPQRDQMWVGLYSFFDKQGPEADPIVFRAIPKNSHFIAGAEDSRAVARLLWFSRGFYTVQEHADGSLSFNDLRFGRSDGWLTDQGEYIFVFDLEESAKDSGDFVNFSRRQPQFDLSEERFSNLFQRIGGDRGVEVHAAARLAREARGAAGEPKGDCPNTGDRQHAQTAGAAMQGCS